MVSVDVKPHVYLLILTFHVFGSYAAPNHGSLSFLRTRHNATVTFRINAVILADGDEVMLNVIRCQLTY